MKFVMGLLTGLVLGAVGAVAYSVRTGRDLRDAYSEIVADLDQRDMNALAGRLEARFSEMESRIEARLGQVRERVSSAGEASLTPGVHPGADASDAVERTTAPEAAAPETAASEDAASEAAASEAAGA